MTWAEDLAELMRPKPLCHNCGHWRQHDGHPSTGECTDDSKRVERFDTGEIVSDAPTTNRACRCSNHYFKGPY